MRRSYDLKFKIVSRGKIERYKGCTIYGTDKE